MPSLAFPCKALVIFADVAKYHAAGLFFPYNGNKIRPELRCFMACHPAGIWSEILLETFCSLFLTSVIRMPKPVRLYDKNSFLLRT